MSLMEFPEKCGVVKSLRGEGLVEMRRRPAADEHGSDAGLMQRPSQREVRLRVAGASGDLFQPRQPPGGLRLEIDALMSRRHVETRSRRHAVPMFARQKTGAERAIG